MDETLDQFIRTEKTKLDEFKVYWLKMNQENPEQYPILVDNWWEQYNAYTERD